VSSGTRRLIGDIGGTNARFALAENGWYGEIRGFIGEEYASFEAAIEAFLETLPPESRPAEAAFAIAGPVEGERISLTNHPWSFTRTGLKQRFGWDRLVVVNDFAANALSLPWLGPEDFHAVGDGETRDNAAMAILGPGTGLGVSGLLPAGEGNWVPLQGEGGHVTLSAENAREAAVIGVLRDRFGHCSAERVLSGDGLVNLYETLSGLDGLKADGLKAAQITDEAAIAANPKCREAVEMFCGMLGSVAGNLALTLGARGGVYIAGGIVPRLGQRFAASPFRRRFEEKGRFRSYLAAIPTRVIVHRNPALVALARLD
jgi:glucokinase